MLFIPLIVGFSLLIVCCFLGTEKSESDEKIATLTKNLSKALDSNRNTKIVQILRFLLSTPSLSASKNTIMEKCGISKTGFHSYTRWESQGRKNKILTRNGDEWEINPMVFDGIQSVIPRLYT